MSLTTGRGPLSGNPAGRFSPPIPEAVVYVEPFGRRVRGITDGHEVVDSERVLLVHRPNQAPTYAFPVDDVHDFDGEPESEADGHIRLPWDAVEEWYEEDEQVFGHPRNPYHRIDCVRTSRRLRAEVPGAVLVDTTETLGLYETALAPRLYVHRRLVRTDLLVAGSTATHCPYKGTASYWSAVVDGVTIEDVAWSYEEPLPESVPIRGMLCFDEARVTVVADLPL
ncbi:MAG TPA: DUF427 domain-containing protein [Acidimicrobiales bacterium]